jgi:hypothetical protein
LQKIEPKLQGASSTRRVLIVLWIPSADREGRTLPDQDEWKSKSLEFFGTAYGGATAMPRAEGIWRDDDNGGNLVREFPILLHCYVTEDQAEDKKLLGKLGTFCRRLGKETRQGEIALLIDGVYHGFKNFA